MTQHSLLTKVIRSIKNRGALKTALRIIRYAFRSNTRKRNWDNVFNSPSVEERFTKIFAKNLWRNGESLSGAGSTLEYTKNIRRCLPELIETFSITSVFDAPCGDFNWMKSALSKVKIKYVGGDIVKPLVDRNNSYYKSHEVTFVHLDIRTDRFPQADLWICRDCLFHLSFDDTFQTLARFIESGIPYVLTTTNKNVDGFKNVDIQSGDWRLIDLFSDPYCFDPDVLIRFDDWMKPHPPREMCLWSRDQIIQSHGMRNFCRDQPATLSGFGNNSRRDSR